MTDDREHDDPAGWFAAQFGSHDDDAPDDDTGSDAAGSDDTDDTDTGAGGSSAAEGDGAPRAARPTSAAHPGSPIDPAPWSAVGDSAEPVDAPSAPPSGGFNWGLKPSNPAARTPAVPAASEPPGEPVATPPVAVPPIAVPQVVTPPIAAPPATASPFAPPPLVEPPLPATSVFTPPLPVVPPATPGALPSEPQPFDAALAGGPSTEAEPPTVAMPWEGPATELFAPPVASASVAEPATELLGGFGPGAGASAEEAPVDALFGESQFREYETGSLAAVGSPAKSAKTANTAQPAAPRPPRAPIPRSQKVLFWIAGSLAALLVLVALFFLGTKLPRAETAPAAIATPKASATPAPSPTPTVLPAGPLAAGNYKWDQLLGGECLEPFTSPWAEKFTVVDCTVPHPAQMVARGVFAETPPAAGDGSKPATPSVGGEASSYPGADALQAQINLLCTTPGVIDFAAAGAYSDIQILGSYPATDKQWADGERSYFCFVTRSSGEPLTGSVAVPKAP